MAEKKNERLSADELLRRLKENIGEDAPDDGASAKKYKFTRTKKEMTDTIEEPLSDYSYESPVPKSNVEGLDVDALMRMYLSDEDYEVASGKKQTDPFTETIDSAELDGVVAQPTDYQAPDQDTYSELNVDGKVCDVPQLGVKEQPENDAPETAAATVDGDETIRVEDLGKYIRSSSKGMTDDEFDDIFGEVPIVPISIPEEPDGNEDENKEEIAIVGQQYNQAVYDAEKYENLCSACNKMESTTWQTLKTDELIRCSLAHEEAIRKIEAEYQ